MEIFKIIVCIIISYLLGSINFAVIISKFRNKDIRKSGSGNPGTMNMLRSVGKFWGCLTFVCDFLKGVIVALLGRFWLDSFNWLCILGAIAVCGHIFSVFLKFKGGKGVATSLGVFVVVNPIVGLIGFIGLILYLVLFKVGFIGSILAVTGIVIAEIIILHNYVGAIVSLTIIWILVIYSHRGNIKRLIKGEENKLSLFGKNKQNETVGNKETNEEKITTNEETTANDKEIINSEDKDK